MTGGSFGVVRAARCPLGLSPAGGGALRCAPPRGESKETADPAGQRHLASRQRRLAAGDASRRIRLAMGIGRGFDRGAAARLMRQRWDDGVMDIAFGPFEAYISAREAAFGKVPMSRRQQKNKAKVFRMRGECAAEFPRVMRQSLFVSHVLRGTMQDILQLLLETQPRSYEAVRGRLDALVERWKETMPRKLVGRDERAVLEYATQARDLEEACVMEMLDCEHALAARAEPSGMR